MRALACVVFLVGCGGSDGPVEGDPLIQSTLMAQFNNREWMPLYGFGRAETNNFAMYVGSEKISCADDFKGSPRDGTYAAMGVPLPLAVGNTPTALFNILDVKDGTPVSKSSNGSIMITSVNATDVSAVLGFDLSIDGGRYSLNGAVTLLRCP